MGHCGVQVTESSTKKQHSLSVQVLLTNKAQVDLQSTNKNTALILAR